MELQRNATCSHRLSDHQAIRGYTTYKGKRVVRSSWAAAWTPKLCKHILKAAQHALISRASSKSADQLLVMNRSGGNLSKVLEKDHPAYWATFDTDQEDAQEVHQEEVHEMHKERVK